MAVQVSNNYRATFVLDTRGVEESVESLYETITKALTELGGEVTKVENHGTREMTRASRNTKQTSGVYVQYEFAAPSDVPGNVHEKFRLDNRVDRIIIERI
ncbi:MAG: 30S ribosomal protein S6 [Opitutales bacterium]|nr:30S ribosomal protein S6 [Opitutales bacterium]